MLRTSWRFGLTVAVVHAATIVAMGEPRLESLRSVYNAAPHSAFTDLIRFDNTFYTTFRTGSQHGVPALNQPGGVVQLLKSLDGSSWNSVASFSLGATNHDLRDPKLSVSPNGELMLLATDVPHAGSGGIRKSYTWTSTDGTNWSTPTAAMADAGWLWRTEWNPATNFSYGISYNTNSTRLNVSTNGLNYGTVVSPLTEGNEAVMLFLEDGTTAALVRREGAGAQIGTSTNLTDWTFRDTGQFVGGPDMIRIPDGRIVVGGRFLDNFTTNPRMSLGYLDLASGTIEEFLELPSGGDTGYPGLAWHEDKLWVSYYSSHIGSKASIYLATVSFDDTPQLFSDSFARADGADPINSIGAGESGGFSYIERGNTASQAIPLGTAQISNNRLLVTGSQVGTPTNSATGGVYLAGIDQADLSLSVDLGFALAGPAPSGVAGSDSNRFNNTALLMLRSREGQNFGSNNPLENGLIAIEIGPNGDLLIREQTGAGTSGLSTVQSSFNYFTNASATREPLPGVLPLTWGTGSFDTNQNGYLDGDETVKVRALLDATSLRVFLNDLQYGPTFTLSQTSAAAGQINGVGLHKNRLGSTGGFVNQVVSYILLDNLEISSNVTVSGDFDGSGTVDGRDFLAWQRGTSPNPLSAEDLADWQQAFGASQVTSTLAVPEPVHSFYSLAIWMMVAHATRKVRGGFGSTATL
jgi:hypothetical protein